MGNDVSNFLDVNTLGEEGSEELRDMPIEEINKHLSLQFRHLSELGDNPNNIEFGIHVICPENTAEEAIPLPYEPDEEMRSKASKYFDLFLKQASEGNEGFETLVRENLELYQAYQEVSNYDEISKTPIRIVDRKPPFDNGSPLVRLSIIRGRKEGTVDLPVNKLTIGPSSIFFHTHPSKDADKYETEQGHPFWYLLSSVGWTKQFLGDIHSTFSITPDRPLDAGGYFNIISRQGAGLYLGRELMPREEITAIRSSSVSKNSIKHVGRWQILEGNPS
ncbi:MAG: hypothetical protein Q9M91_03415 [Candidatus Dojkabacteria bacterium]|nr:hypothetical protein [Candidatus Dojkabacteria bacterium]MDQ7020872.1 hypothetical protein [Candidatus Dojkabacteria bacterium]